MVGEMAEMKDAQMAEMKDAQMAERRAWTWVATTDEMSVQW